MADKQIQEFCNNIFYVEPFQSSVKCLKDNGYIAIKVKTGCLLDDIAFIHPSTIQAYIDKKHNPKRVFTFKEQYRNSQSSTYKILRHNSLKKYHIKCLEEQGFLD